jgi:DNA-binding response OmpR family regulator
MSEPRANQTIHQVLLVENDKTLADLIRTGIGNREDLRVHIMSDVVNAIRFLAKRDGFAHAPTPDLVLLDLHLRYFSGTALLQERRRRPSWSGIPVVTIGTSKDDEATCLSLGATAHVMKPQDPAAWRDLVGDILNQHLPLLTPP